MDALINKNLGLTRNLLGDDEIANVNFLVRRRCSRAVELGFKKPINPNLGFLGFLILLFYFNSF